MILHLLKLVWHRKRANALLIAEILLSFIVVFVVLTMAASLLMRWREPLGFNYRNVWILSVASPAVPGDSGAADDPLRPVIDRLIREIKGFPQVIDAAADDTPPYGNATSEGVWRINGKQITLKRDTVTDNFANVMQLKLLRGRWFSPDDDGLAHRPVVIDADLARDLFGTRDPVGQRFDQADPESDRVVGVVAPYRKDGEIAPTAQNMAFFRKSLAKPSGTMPRNILVRVRPGTSPEFEQALANHLHAVEPNTAFQIRHLERMRDKFLRFRVAPVLVLGIISLFLISMVALGLTGVLWQTVTRRTREIGLRRAVGASGRSVRRQILGEVALITTLALIVGSAIVMQLPLLGVFGLVQPDVFTIGIVAALATIYLITLLCGAYPSWLASTVEPAEALRYE
jgi:putative ABC transport system permease protein